MEKVILYLVKQTDAFSLTGVQRVFISPMIISRWGIAVTFRHLDPLIPQHDGLLIPELLCVTCRYTPDLQCVTQMGKNEIFLPLPLICQADSWQTCCYLSHCWTAAATDYHVFLMAVRGLDKGHIHTVSPIWKDSVGEHVDLYRLGQYLIWMQSEFYDFHAIWEYLQEMVQNFVCCLEGRHASVFTERLVQWNLQQLIPGLVTVK